MAIKIKFLPARFGDSIWIEYGDNDEHYRIFMQIADQHTKIAKRDVSERRVTS